MSAQAHTEDAVVGTRAPGMDAWVALLRAHSAVTRRFNRELIGSHGLTINDFEVLMHLEHAEYGKLRRVDLAERVLLTASGITRLLEGLERSGLVRKASCAADGRVTYAEITDSGRRVLADARCSHVASVTALFAERYSDAEVARLTDLLHRLPLAPPSDACPG